MPCQPFLIEGYDNLWALDVGFLGRDQVSLIRVLHFIRNMSSPLESVAPIIRSGSKPGQSLVAFLTLLSSSLVCSPPPYLPNQNQLCAYLPLIFSVLRAVFCDCRNSAMRSGQSSFSSGSHVLSSSENLFHFRRYSTLPFTTQWFKTLPSLILLPLLAPPPLSSCFIFSP